MHALLEAFMLICFSVSWQMSIVRMVRTRTASGKSLWAVLLVTAGYLCGVTSKILIWQDTGHLSPLILFYSWNMFVTAVDCLLIAVYSGRLGWVYRPVMVR